MKKTYTVHYNKNLNIEHSVPHNINVEEIGECPLCHFAASPIYIDGFLIVSNDNDIPFTVYLVLYCSRCKELYTARYSGDSLNSLSYDYAFPYHTNKKTFSDNINSLSPEFVTIFNQAQEAESNINTIGLAGIGYRKAIEFLVKDYLVNLKHKDKETTIKLELNKCVNLLDKDLQDIARASVWLGNDETHYFRKNPQYDLQDLKEFIDCLVYDIEREYVRIKAKQIVLK